MYDNNVFDVAIKFDIDNVDDDDDEFKSLNVVLDVEFKLDIDNVDDDDKLFKFVFVAYTVKSGLKSFIDVFYHQIRNGIQGCTTRAPPLSRGGRGRTGNHTIASPMP
jgi:hypothetical protein